MFISTRYLLRQLFFTTMFLLALLSFTIWLSQSLRFIEFMVQKGLNFSNLLMLSTLALPEVISVILPFAFLIAVVFILHRAETDHELIILKATGISPFTIVKPVFICGIIYALILGAFTTYIIPKSLEKFHKMTHQLHVQTPSLYIQDKQFINFGKITIYIRQAVSGQKLKGVLIHDNKTQGGSTLIAQEGEVFRRGEKVHLTLYEGSRFESDKKTGRPIILRFDQYDVDINEPDATTESMKHSVHQLSTWELIQPTSDQAQSQPYLRRLSELHKRVVMPFMLIIFGILAASLLLSGDYQRKRNYRKVILPFVACLGIQILVMVALNGAKRLMILGIGPYFLLVLASIMSVYILYNPFPKWLRRMGV